jgi:aquaporin Z
MKAAARGFQVEYAIEAALLGLFMIAACGFTVLLEHPASPVRHTLPDPVIRRMLMGLAMGSTAVTLIYSPWGKRSGAHMNPAVTLTFARLGKVAPGGAGGPAAGASHSTWGDSSLAGSLACSWRVSRSAGC